MKLTDKKGEELLGGVGGLTGVATGLRENLLGFLTTVVGATKAKLLLLVSRDVCVRDGLLLLLLSTVASLLRVADPDGGDENNVKRLGSFGGVKHAVPIFLRGRVFRTV